jgi:hypothetical protein
LFLILQARIAKKAPEVQQCLHVTEVGKVNVQSRAEFTAANANVAEVEQDEKALKSDYSSLHSEFSDLQTAHAALGKEKEDVEKVERKKAQQFCNLLHKKLAGLCNDMEKSVATLAGNVWNFLLPTILMVPCWIGSGWRCRCCPPRSLNLTRTLPVMRWLVF